MTAEFLKEKLRTNFRNLKKEGGPYSPFQEGNVIGLTQRSERTVIVDGKGTYS